MKLKLELDVATRQKKKPHQEQDNELTSTIFNMHDNMIESAVYSSMTMIACTICHLIEVR